TPSPGPRKTPERPSVTGGRFEACIVSRYECTESPLVTAPRPAVPASCPAGSGHGAGLAPLAAGPCRMLAGDEPAQQCLDDPPEGMRYRRRGRCRRDRVPEPAVG